MKTKFEANFLNLGLAFRNERQDIKHVFIWLPSRVFGAKLLIIFLCYINKMKFNLFSLFAVFIPLLIKKKIVLGSRRLSQMIVSVSFGK